MARKNKKYDKDFKIEASKLVTQHGYSYAEAARQLGLEDWAIRGWVKTLRESGDLPPASLLDRLLHPFSGTRFEYVTRGKCEVTHGE